MCIGGCVCECVLTVLVVVPVVLQIIEKKNVCPSLSDFQSCLTI